VENRLTGQLRLPFTRAEQSGAPTRYYSLILLLVTALLAGRAFAAAVDPRDLSVLLDRIVAEEMERLGIPGAVVAVTTNQKVLYAKGYGYASLEKKIPVEVERTLFYLASVTKTFTAQAVLQLVEEGRLDLQEDVNRRLRTFQLPASYRQPITLAHLLTHTAGFDDRNIGYVARTAEGALPLGEYLACCLPPPVAPPGRVISYSNHGYGLAGYLVERAAGIPYPEYVQTRILRPLGMTRSTARVPLPPELEPDRATGYEYEPRAERLAPQPLGFRKLPPAGSVSATAADMSRFLMHHLSRAPGDPMHRRQFTHHPRLPGFAYGFYEREQNGLRALMHAGDYPGYSTLLLLLPEQKIGIFTATNMRTGSFRERLVREFFDRYYPFPKPAALSDTDPPAQAAARARRLAGSYHTTRYSRHSVEKIAVWDSTYRVAATSQGRLNLTPTRAPSTSWVEVEPMLYRRSDGVEHLAFREDPDTGKTYLFLSGAGGAPQALERLAWKDDVMVQRPLLLVLAAVFASSFTVWPLAWLVFGRRRPPWPAAIGALNGLLAITFMAGLDILIGNSFYRMRLVYGMTPEMIAMLWVPLAMIPLTAALLYWAARIWRRSQWSVSGRIYYSALAAASVAFLAFLAEWNLIGFRY